jgi:TolB-like protein
MHFRSPGETLTALCRRSRCRVASNHTILGLCLVLLVTATSARLASADPRRVLLLPFDGPSATEVQSVISSSLSSDVVLVPAEQAERAAQLLSARAQNAAEAYSALSRRLKAVAVIEGKVVKDDRWRLRLSIRQGANGNVSGTVAWSGLKFKEMVANVQRGAPYWMQSMLDAAENGSTAAPAPRPVASARASAAMADADDPPGAAVPSVRAAAYETPPEPMWEISLGPRVMARTFTYTDNLAGLPGYTLSGAPALALDGALFPTAGSASPARNFGFAGHFETSVAVKTVGRNGAASHDTSLRAYWLGARYRVTSNNFLFTFGADYGEHLFNIDVQDTAPPNVRYSIIRPSATVRADAGGGLSLTLTLAYLHVLSVGAMGQDDRFPRDSAVGAEVGAGIGYKVDDNFDVRLAADLRHYAHSMHVQQGDPLIVGGALDEHFGATLLIGYHSR